MKSLRLCAAALAFGLMTLLAACRTTPTPQAISPPAEVMNKQYLYEVVRYLYRWQMDDSEIRKLYGDKEIVFWVRRLHPALDPGDESILAEIFLPQLDMTVKVKKADYRIEELNTEVKGRSFRITQVTRGHLPSRRPADAVGVQVSLQEIREHLFNTRNQLDYSDATMLERLRALLHKQVTAAGKKSISPPTTDQVAYVSSLSPVANEVWVFWEERQILFYFASDIDLSNPTVWERQTLLVRSFDIADQAITSHEEAPGSNRFLTRNQIGRVLYNCIVLGQRMIVKPQ